MKRREFIAGLAGAAAWPIAAQAQQVAMPVVGFLSPIKAADAGIFLNAYRQGLNEAGFVPGQNVRVEYRWAEGQYDRLPGLAADLAKMRVAVITTMGDGAFAAKAAQSNDAIPVVFSLGDDPVTRGLVASLNRPGGNITGATGIGHTLGPKRLEFLYELLPTAKTIGFLTNPKQASRLEVNDVEQTAHALGLKLEIFNASSADEIEKAFGNIAQDRIDALIIAVDTFLYAESARIASLAARHLVPTIGSLRAFTVAGGLISFNSSVHETMRQAAIYTGRILKGEKAADLPVHLPTKYELIVNLKAAKALGLTMPTSMLLRADEVIE
jgi:putative tryptophan/tyrosine transport system substrate-binding protein